MVTDLLQVQATELPVYIDPLASYFVMTTMASSIVTLTIILAMVVIIKYVVLLLYM